MTPGQSAGATKFRRLFEFKTDRTVDPADGRTAFSPTRNPGAANRAGFGTAPETASPSGTFVSELETVSRSRTARLPPANALPKTTHYGNLYYTF